jgi:flavin-dependent dehydrogenase
MSAPWDVIVAGAGPGGSASAAFLAREGHRVLVLEKEHFPRFHIGESLLPASTPILLELGIEPDDSTFLFKRGAQFVCERTGRLQAFSFEEAMPGPPRSAFQVERAGFDAALAGRARAHGAEVRHGVRVRSVEIDDAEVRVETSEGLERGRYFIDATGQDRLLARRKRSVRPYRHFGRAAVFTHFEDLTEEGWSLVGEGNDIRIMMLDDGWAWVIPLTGKRLSVGLVMRKQGITKEMLDAYLASSPLISAMTAGAARRETRLLGNYSFKNAAPSGKRYACVGDSSCFIDPVFSSGVTLALTSAKEMAALLSPALKRGEEANPELMRPIHEATAQGYETFAALVHRFYNTKIVDNLIFGAPADGELRPSVVSVLGGDVFREDNPFRDMLLNSRSTPWREEERATEPSAETIEEKLH